MAKLLVRLLLMGLVVAAAGAANSAEEKGKKVASDELDRKIRININRVINQGAALFNSGNQEGAYQYFRGSLTAVATLLDHRPALAKSIEDGLKKAESLPSVRERAFLLRGVLGEILKTLPKNGVVKKPKPPEKPRTLWEQLGGEEAVEKIVDDFVKRAEKDPNVNFTRKGTKHEWKPTPENVTLLKKHLVQFISSVTGGPKTYKGPDMKATHKGMKITAAEFDAAAFDLGATLDAQMVPEKAKKELLALVASTKKAIVAKTPDKPKDKDKPKEKDE